MASVISNSSIFPNPGTTGTMPFSIAVKPTNVGTLSPNSSPDLEELAGYNKFSFNYLFFSIADTYFKYIHFLGSFDNFW